MEDDEGSDGALVVVVLAEALTVAAVLGLPGFSAPSASAAVGNALLAAAISFLLVPVVAWVTTLGRGYMAPLAFALLAMALGNLFGKTGWGIFFPWSIVPLMIGAVGQPLTALPPASYAVVALTFVAGICATIAQIRWGDEQG